MAHDNTLTVTRTVGPLKLTPVDALTRFSPAKLPRGALAAHGLSHLRYGVQVANMGVLVPSKVVSEVVDGLIVHAMPNAASWFPGLVNLRGNLIPVFDLRALTDAPTEQIKRLLVIDRGERAGAIPVDELPRPVDPQHRSAHCHRCRAAGASGRGSSGSTRLLHARLGAARADARSSPMCGAPIWTTASSGSMSTSPRCFKRSALVPAHNDPCPAIGAT